jgi:AcrR family transcriptional regulator
MRSIAADAGITIQLLIYHAKSKAHLWQMAMENILTQYEKFDSKTKLLPAESSAADRLRQTIADIVHYTALHPELHRIMTQEAGHLSPRLVWMIENFTKAAYTEFVKLVEDAQRDGAIRTDVHPHRLRFAVFAIAAVPFSVAAEYEYLTGRDPFQRNEIAKTIELIQHMVFGK